MTNLVTRGIGLGNKALLASMGLGLAPLPVAAGGAFYAEPDRRLEKRVRELVVEEHLIEQQITDHIRAKEHAKPAEVRKEPRFTLEAARNLARERHDTELLLTELTQIKAEIKRTTARLTAIRQEEDDMEVLLLLQ